MSRRPAVRDVLVVLLTLTTGAVDATCFLHLGNVFSSVITGNMVLLGVAAGTLAPALATHSGVALAGYAAGVAIGAPAAALALGGRGGEGSQRQGSQGPGSHGRSSHGRSSQGPGSQGPGSHGRSSHGRGGHGRGGHGRGGSWPPGVTVALVVEICVLAGFSAGWELTGGRPGAVAQLLMVAALAAAMGIQSAAVRRLGQMSTTYLTGTLTGVIASLVTGARPEGLWRSLGVLAAVVVGAAAGAVAADQAPALTPVVIIAPVLAVVIGSAVGFDQVTRRPGGSGAR